MIRSLANSAESEVRKSHEFSGSMLSRYVRLNSRRSNSIPGTRLRITNEPGKRASSRRTTRTGLIGVQRDSILTIKISVRPRISAIAKAINPTHTPLAAGHGYDGLHAFSNDPATHDIACAFGSMLCLQNKQDIQITSPTRAETPKSGAHSLSHFRCSVSSIDVPFIERAKYMRPIRGGR